MCSLTNPEHVTMIQLFHTAAFCGREVNCTEREVELYIKVKCCHDCANVVIGDLEDRGYIKLCPDGRIMLTETATADLYACLKTYPKLFISEETILAFDRIAAD